MCLTLNTVVRLACATASERREVWVANEKGPKKGVSVKRQLVVWPANSVPEEKRRGPPGWGGALAAAAKPAPGGQATGSLSGGPTHPDSLLSCSRLPQDTLAYATALLNEKEQSGSSNGSESSPANENGERHLQQVRLWPAAQGKGRRARSEAFQKEFP